MAANQSVGSEERPRAARELRREAVFTIAKTLKTGASPAFNQILCPIDFGPSSLKALALAKQIASENDAALYVVHVCPAILIPVGGTATTRRPGEGC